MKLNESRVIGPQGLMYRAIQISEIMPAGVFLAIPNEEIMAIHRARPELFIGRSSDDWLLIPVHGGTACVMGASALKMFEQTAGLSVVHLEQADFSDALMWIKEGKRVARRGWNGKGQFVYLLKGQKLAINLNYGFGMCQGEPTCRDMLLIRTAQNELVSWVPSVSDLLADDWIAFP